MRGEPIQQTLPDIVCPLCGHTAGPGTLITGGRGRQIGWHCGGCGADVTAHKSAHLSLIDTAAAAGFGHVSTISKAVDTAGKAYEDRR